jgi:DNA replication initiation complex subunit (GINS family)
MITYKDIYDLARNERYSEQLQKLQENFLNEISSYLREKKEIATKEEESSEEISKTKKQLENALTLFKELVLRRRQKILNLVLIASDTGISKKDFENMFDFEKELFDDLLNSVDISDQKINGILNGKNNSIGILVTFKENIGEFMDLNGEKLGGFEKGQIVTLPQEIAQILVEDGKIEFIEQ